MPSVARLLWARNSRGRWAKDGAKERAGPCQATQATPFCGHAAAGGAGEPRLGGADVRSRSRARTQLFPSPAPCRVAGPRRRPGRLLGAPSLGHASLPSSAASGRSYPAPPGYPRQPRVGTRTLTPTDPSGPAAAQPRPPRTQSHGPHPRAPLELGREETPLRLPHLPVHEPRQQLQPPFLVTKSIITEPGTTASSLPWESWGQNPLCKESLRPRGAQPAVARLAGVLVGRRALPSPTPAPSGASKGAAGRLRLSPVALGVSPPPSALPFCHPPAGPWSLSTQLPTPRPSVLPSIREPWPLPCPAPAPWDQQTPTARDPSSPRLRRGTLHRA